MMPAQAVIGWPGRVLPPATAQSSKNEQIKADAIAIQMREAEAWELMEAQRDAGPPEVAEATSIGSPPTHSFGDNSRRGWHQQDAR